MKAQASKKKVVVNFRLPRATRSALQVRLRAEGRSAQRLFELTAAAYADGRMEWPGPPQKREAAP